MRRHHFLLCVFVLCMLPAFAQNPFRTKPTRRQLTEENGRLKSSIDSMRTVIDSLQRADSVQKARHQLELEQARKPLIEHTMADYNPDMADSLLAVWFESTAVKYEDCVNRYDMSQEVLTSDVSDSVMIARLAAMNSFISIPFDQTVKNYMILYSERMKTTMGRIIGLSRYYFPVFEEILAGYGLPLELKYMAVVESMLNPTASSRAGARGMWQFMFNTAKGYGLEINSYEDERLDVEKSTDAAARYLRDSYRVFGDWALAISSYNCGAGNIMKAIRRSAGSREFWDIYPYLKRETRGYVPAFVGVMYAMTYYKEYGIEPKDVGMPVAVDTFMVSRKLHFEQVREVVGVPVETVRCLNPQYVHDIVPGMQSRPCVLRLPYSWSAAFLEADSDSLYAYRAKELLSDEVVNASTRTDSPASRIVYKVKDGDYLGKIAARHHVTVAQIKSWNHLRSDRLRIGQILYIYR